MAVYILNPFRIIKGPGKLRWFTTCFDEGVAEIDVEGREEPDEDGKLVRQDLLLSAGGCIQNRCVSGPYVWGFVGFIADEEHRKDLERTPHLSIYSLMPRGMRQWPQLVWGIYNPSGDYGTRGFICPVATFAKAHQTLVTYLNTPHGKGLRESLNKFMEPGGLI